MALPNDMKKKEVPVTIVLVGGMTIDCSIFVEDGQRLLELMNDHRHFIPYVDSNGDVTIIQKSTIARITPLEDNMINNPSTPDIAEV